MRASYPGHSFSDDFELLAKIHTEPEKYCSCKRKGGWGLLSGESAFLEIREAIIMSFKKNQLHTYRNVGLARLEWRTMLCSIGWVECNDACRAATRPTACSLRFIPTAQRARQPLSLTHIPHPAKQTDQALDMRNIHSIGFAKLSFQFISQLCRTCNIVWVLPYKRQLTNVEICLPKYKIRSYTYVNTILCTR